MRALFITSTRLGDAVLSTGVLAHLLDRSPDARVTVACGPVAVPLFATVPGVEAVIPMIKGPLGAHWRRLWVRTVGTRWDVVVDLRGSALAWTLRAGERRVFRTPVGDEHRVDQLRHGLGIAAAIEPRLWLSGADRAAAAALLGDDPRPVLALCPTANWSFKAWPADRFVALIERLTGAGGDLAGARVLVAGGAAERVMAAPVLAAIPEARAIDAIGTVPLTALAAALARCRLVVANDSGLMHLAAAAGAPTLGLFGPSQETHYAPRGPMTAWVRSRDSAEALLARSGDVPDVTGALMTGLAVEPVADAARSLLRRSG
ncbi:MAG: glycosyltransferase family 9 protein [Alphaproteobacteria bacterium]|nr:glycosyltransferase family 9 protein [Alphaproteobacteria bacterium]